MAKQRFPRKTVPFRQLPKSRKRLYLLYIVLYLLVIATMVAQFFNQDYHNVFLCLLTLLLFAVPSFLERRIRLDVPDTLEMIALLFIFAAEVLGEIREFYTTFRYWDMLLHTLNGFLMGAIGISLINILNGSKRFAISLSPLFVAIVAFCFSMTVGVLWEFFEYAMDRLFALDMQKDTFVPVINTVLLHPEGRNIVVHIPVESVVVNGEAWPGYVDIGLIDTMGDLFVNLVGAVVFSVIGYFDTKDKGEGRSKVAEKLMLTRIELPEGEREEPFAKKTAKRRGRRQ